MFPMKIWCVEHDRAPGRRLSSRRGSSMASAFGHSVPPPLVVGSASGPSVPPPLVADMYI
ncbi:hypothetical protein Taro_007027 [Colocasia esculenta]|uniref:Uncharacterized protein n=1 Tax=Colocasia esculenta TaxID=4460 RepID=A0A843TZD0_COLES|nr:hypothetical protein [Colocasia esculenta]